MFNEVKKWICTILFSSKKYHNVFYDNNFTRKDVLNILNDFENNFLVKIFGGSSPSLENVKKKLEQDFLCIDKEIPLFLEEMYELRTQYDLYENVLLEDWSHDYSVIQHDSVFMTDGEVQREYEKIDALVKKAEAGLEKIEKEIFYFVSFWNIA
ncbi:hypothetical protein ABC382_01125 [Lysinibacillus sp. 1P01SD]|uniref:hypothetical protein n=1 Tax=Lysinibacillus sp. 1P01SD TaxID=3132285 RepID=UPI0039A06D8F